MKEGGFSRGSFRYPSPMRVAPQETRTYFVTAVTAGPRRIFQVTANADLLQKTIFDYRAQNRFLLHAYVIMPDHFHAILTPAPDVSLEKAMQFIKGGFSFRLKSKLDVWERGFNESQILSAEKFRSVAHYIEENLSGVAWLLRRRNIHTLPSCGRSPIQCQDTCIEGPGLKARLSIALFHGPEGPCSLRIRTAADAPGAHALNTPGLKARSLIALFHGPEGPCSLRCLTFDDVGGSRDLQVPEFRQAKRSRL